MDGVVPNDKVSPSLMIDLLRPHLHPPPSVTCLRLGFSRTTDPPNSDTAAAAPAVAGGVPSRAALARPRSAAHCAGPRRPRPAAARACPTPPAGRAPVTDPVAVVADGKQRARAGEFIAFRSRPAAQEVLTRYGCGKP